MHTFRTEIDPENPGFSISHRDQLMMMGSCFAEHMGEYLRSLQFRIDLNPFGILFNPVSIAGGIQRLLTEQPYELEDLFVRDGLWHSFDHHSRFSGTDPLEVLEVINTRLGESAQTLKSANYFFITFGTARVYHHLKSGRVVSNCHKLPGAEFSYELLRVGDIVRLYTRLLQDLIHVNPDIRIILTVSPVRYWKDGPAGNQVSKSTLILAVSELVSNFEEASYFPSYEIFMDDLRDYRFYGDDFLHPAPAGISYVRQKFSQCYFSEETKEMTRRIEKILKDRSHIPLNPGSDAYREFQQSLEKKTEALKKDYPGFTFFED